MKGRRIRFGVESATLPNKRVQRTRLRSPLTRHPLGRTKVPRRRPGGRLRVTMLAVMAILAGSTTARASSPLNVGPLWDVDEVSVEPVLVGNPIGLEGERWEPLFVRRSADAGAFRLAAAAAIAQHLKAGGLRVTAGSENKIQVSIYGGKDLSHACPENLFLVEVWVHKPHDQAEMRTVVSSADDAELASALTRAVLQNVDDFVSMRTRYREELKKKP